MSFLDFQKQSQAQMDALTGLVQAQNKSMLDQRQALIEQMKAQLDAAMNPVWPALDLEAPRWPTPPEPIDPPPIQTSDFTEILNRIDKIEDDIEMIKELLTSPEEEPEEEPEEAVFFKTRKADT